MAKNELKFKQKQWMIGAGERIYARQYRRAVHGLGDIAHELVDQKMMADMANPFYNQFARGGEGHLEVGKNVYYTKNQLCHMVLALKPFGCMPSSQSDGVQSAVANHFKEMIFLPIETSGEGEINAHSRVQMALGEAKVKARMEFEQALKATGKRLDDIKDYVAEHPELRNVFYPGAAPSRIRRRGCQLRVPRQRSDERQDAAEARSGNSGQAALGYSRSLDPGRRNYPARAAPATCRRAGINEAAGYSRFGLTQGSAERRRQPQKG